MYRKFGFSSRRAPLIALLALLLVPCGPPAGAVTRPDPRGGADKSADENYDIRINGRASLPPLLEEHFRGRAGETARAAASRRRLQTEGLERLRSVSRGARVTFSPVSGSAEVVAGRRGFLTPPAPGRSAEDIVLDFIGGNTALYGMERQHARELRVLGESRSRSGGLRMVRLGQEIDGRPVFQGEIRATVDREGRLIRTVGRPVPRAGTIRSQGGSLLRPEEALSSALATVGLGIGADSMSVAGSAPGGFIDIAVDHDLVNRAVRSRLVWFPLTPDLLVPAWSQVVFLKGPEDWYTLVDARTGTLLYRKNIRHNISTQQARFSVYSQSAGLPADSPAPASPNALLPGSGTQFTEIARSTESMLSIQDPVASPGGWIADGGNTTTGNNVDAYLDRDGNDLPDAGTLDFNGRPVGNPDTNGNDRDFLGSSPRSFSYTPAPSGGDPDAGDDPALAAYQRGVVTNLFYITNFFHDAVYALGFDEAAGNYQTDNFGRGGLGNDEVQAEAQQSAADIFFGGANNANFSPAPDGTPGIMRMFIWNFPAPIRDGSLDAEIVIHELTHGLTSRLIGDAAGLNWTPGRAMGEGWSDFYALSLLNNSPGDDPDGQYAMGAYATYNLAFSTDNYVYGIRRFPITTDNSINPLTWADVDDTTDDMSGGFPPSPLGFEGSGAFEVHNSGEVWALSLWEACSRVIADNGGDVAAGNQIMLQIVTDALKMTSNDPGFIEARDALFDADCAANACANEESIWEGFADRGLGYGAEASLGVAAHVGIKESFVAPHLVVDGVTIDDSAGDGNGAIDPGEAIAITVDLLNPWRHPSKGVPSASALLSSMTSEVLVNDGFSSYGPIAAQGTGSGDPFTFTVDPDATCGQTLSFELETTSALGTFTARFELRVGQPVGPGSPIALTRTIAGGAAIPENNPAGAIDTFSVTTDLDILDLDFRIDSLTHTAVGDLSVMLKAPGGFGADLIYRMSVCIDPFGCFLGFNGGNNFTSTTIDDDSTNDLTTIGDLAAPFTGDWFATFNSSEWVGPDPVGQMSNYSGIGTKGDWRVFVADHADNDTGSLNSWSLLVTPMTYSCCQASPDPDGDLIGAVCDNCPVTLNPLQQDGDSDGTGDLCDCAPANGGVFAVPAEVSNLEMSIDTMSFSWDSAAPGAGPFTAHDALRGGTEDLPVGGSLTETCVVSGTLGSTWIDASEPPAGSAFWYLIRGRNTCGKGTYGFESAGPERISATCP